MPLISNNIPLLIHDKINFNHRTIPAIKYKKVIEKSESLSDRRILYKQLKEGFDFRDQYEIKYSNMSVQE